MRTPTTPSTRLTGPRSLFAALAGITVSAAVMYGCTGKVGIGPNGLPEGTGEGGAGGMGNDGGPLTPEQMFAALLPELKGACGACHAENAPAGYPIFLAAPEYDTVKAYPGLVIKNWEGSLFLQYAVSGTSHTGTALNQGELAGSLYPQMQEWLEAEAARLPDPTPGVKRVGPFAVNTLGFNSFYFSGLGDEFKDIALTFNAGIDPTSMQLTLTNMQINPSKTTGVHLVHPVFQVFPAGSDTGEDDPLDTFATFDATYQPNETGPFTTDPFALSNWEAGATVGIVFDVFEVIDGMGGGACGDVASFMANAQGPLSTNCAAACHGGGNATAQGAMDLGAIDTDPEGTCAIVRNRINLADPPMSQIFVNSDPNGGANHMFKFDTADNFTAFRDQVILWVQAEAAAMP